MLTKRIAQALALAVEAHDGEKRKVTHIPFIAHPTGGASIALDNGAVEEQTLRCFETLAEVISHRGSYVAKALNDSVVKMKQLAKSC